jgi:Rieske Fe-S protein
MKNLNIKTSIIAALALAGFAMAAAPVAPAAAAAKTEAMAPASEKPAAAQAMKKAKGSIAKGTVLSSDAIGSTLTVKEKKGEVVYSLEKDAKITKGGAAATMDDLKADTKVKIHFKKDGDKMVANAVEIAAEKAAATK